MTNWLPGAANGTSGERLSSVPLRAREAQSRVMDGRAVHVSCPACRERDYHRAVRVKGDSMIPFVESLLNRVLDAASERRRPRRARRRLRPDASVLPLLIKSRRRSSGGDGRQSPVRPTSLAHTANIDPGPPRLSVRRHRRDRIRRRRVSRSDAACSRRAGWRCRRSAGSAARFGGWAAERTAWANRRPPSRFGTPRTPTQQGRAQHVCPDRRRYRWSLRTSCSR